MEDEGEERKIPGGQKTFKDFRAMVLALQSALVESL